MKKYKNISFFKNNSIGTITLGDFKECIKLKNTNSYRIYFKSQDPEFGFLKEEVKFLSN